MYLNLVNFCFSDNDTVNITNILRGLHDDIFTYDNGARMFLPHQAVIFTTPVMQNQGIEEDIINEIAMVHDAGIETYRYTYIELGAEWSKVAIENLRVKFCIYS